MIIFKRLDHVLISIPPGTREEACVFYSDVLGLKEVSGAHPNGAIWFKMGDVELHVREEEGHNPVSSRHPAFEVGSLVEAKAFLAEQGIEIAYSSLIDGRDRCFFRDPWGNRFELIEYESK